MARVHDTLSGSASHRPASKRPATIFCVPAMRRAVPFVLAALIGPLSGAADAAMDKYAITAEEHAACDGDAVSLCSEVKPDADGLLACMRMKRDQLSPACSTAFAAGMRRRHLPL